MSEFGGGKFEKCRRNSGGLKRLKNAPKTDGFI